MWILFFHFSEFYFTLRLDSGDGSCAHHSIQNDLLIPGAGDIGSASFPTPTCSAPSHLIMSWLPWSFHLDTPAKGKNWEKPASLWKNDNWLLCFDGSVCCCFSLISMFSLFCCAPPDTNENVLGDLNRFWMSDLLHWFIAGAESCFSPVSFLDRVRTSILVAKILF